MDTHKGAHRRADSSYDLSKMNGAGT